MTGAGSDATDEVHGSVALPYPEPVLTDGIVALRPWAEADLDCVREASADPEIPKGTTVPARFTPAEGLAFIERQWSRSADGIGVSQAIVEARTDRAVGLVIVSLRPQQHVAGLGYWVVPSARGGRVATRAVRLLAPWALAALRLNRLEAWVHPDKSLRSACS
jgi:[ribosomal protein S5]-alanine N-acetyltransferase